MTGLTLTPDQKADYDREVAEIGARAVEWLDHYQLGTLYSDPDARIWAQVLTMIRAIQASRGFVPAEWMPAFDEDGGWVPSWKN